MLVRSYAITYKCYDRMFCSLILSENDPTGIYGQSRLQIICCCSDSGLFGPVSRKNQLYSIDPSDGPFDLPVPDGRIHLNSDTTVETSMHVRTLARLGHEIHLSLAQLFC